MAMKKGASATNLIIMTIGHSTQSSAREFASYAVDSLAADPERSIFLAAHAVGLTFQPNVPSVPAALSALHRSIVESRARLTFSGQGVLSRMARRPRSAAIYRGSRQDIRRAGNRTGSAREAASRRQACHRLSFGEPPHRLRNRGLLVEVKFPPRMKENYMSHGAVQKGDISCLR